MKRLKVVSVMLALILLATTLPLGGQASVDTEETGSREAVEYVQPELGDAYILEEDISKRGEFEKHFIRSDGTYMVATYPEAVHYSVDDEWLDVNNEIYYNEKIEKYKTSKTKK